MTGVLPFRGLVGTRALLRVRGGDAHAFLQGLFTNDLRTLSRGGSVWGCFLFYTGRVMCDAYLYAPRRDNNNNDHHDVATDRTHTTVYVDVHTSCADELLAYLREMRMRRKVAIDDLSHELAVVASWQRAPAQPPSPSTTTAATTDDAVVDNDGECFVDARNFAIAQQQQQQVHDATAADAAPASCLVSSSSSSSSSSLWPMQLCKVLVPRATATCTHDAAAAYTTLLLASGVGEGPAVFRRDKTLPFEANTDFLGGVSFHKGCYVGQELTHRTHVMLVTRKRTLPLLFGHKDEAATAVTTTATTCTTSTATTTSARPGDGLFVRNGSEKVGEVLDVCGRHGLGLVRLRYVDADTRRIHGLQLRDGTPVAASIPAWWPAKQVRKLLRQQQQQSDDCSNTKRDKPAGSSSDTAQTPTTTVTDAMSHTTSDLPGS